MGKITLSLNRRGKGRTQWAKEKKDGKGEGGAKVGGGDHNPKGYLDGTKAFPSTLTSVVVGKPGDE